MIEIRIAVSPDASGRIQGLTVAGHAEAGPHGSDPICAGVSAVVLGLSYAAEELLGVPLARVRAPGSVECAPPQALGSPEAEQAELLLRSMVVILQAMAHDHPQHIHVVLEDTEEEGV